MRLASRAASLAALTIAAAPVAASLVVHPGMADASHPGRNGRIAFESYRTYGGIPEIYSVNPDGTDLRRLTRNRGGDAFPSYAPDGQTIVFASCRRGGCGVFSMDQEGGLATRLTAVPSVAAEITFSGRAVAFVSRLDGNLYVVDVSSKEIRRVAGGRRSTILEPDFSPSGDRIVFRRGTPSVEHSLLYTIGIDGRGRRRLTSRTTSAWMTQPAFSPDAQHIAFVRRGLLDGGCCDHDVWVMNADGSAPRRVTSDLAEEWSPVFSPDGNQIAFGSYAAGRWSISVVDVVGGNSREVIRGDIVQGPPHPDWQPLR